MSNGLGTIFFYVIFFPLGIKGMKFFNMIYTLTELKSHHQNCNMSSHNIYQYSMGHQRPSRTLKDTSEELLFLGKQFANKCRVILAPSQKEDVRGWWIRRILEVLLGRY